MLSTVCTQWKGSNQPASRPTVPWTTGANCGSDHWWINALKLTILFGWFSCVSFIEMILFWAFNTSLSILWWTLTENKGGQRIPRIQALLMRSCQWGHFQPVVTEKKRCGVDGRVPKCKQRSADNRDVSPRFYDMNYPMKTKLIRKKEHLLFTTACGDRNHLWQKEML